MKLERNPQMTIMNYDLDKIVKDSHPLKRIEKTVSLRKISLGFKELKECIPPAYTMYIAKYFSNKTGEIKPAIEEHRNDRYS